MASSIAGTALWRCPATSVPPSSRLPPSCIFPVSIPSQYCVGSRQSLIFVRHLLPEILLPEQFRSAKIRLFHRVDCHQRQEEQGVAGSKRESGIKQSRKEKNGYGTKFLAVTEGVCIVVAGASYTASLVQKSKQTTSVARSSVAPHLFYNFQDISTWQVPALWAALVINAILRTMQMLPSSSETERKWEEKSIKDFTVDQRIGKLEDDVRSVAAIARILSRHLEKLGVRFRVTRRTLRDPIKETATLAFKTSEVVSALATREDTLEAELRQTRRELRDTQQLLVSMQESQEKQLELLVTAMTRTLKSQRAIEEKITKDSTRTPGKSNKATSIGVGAPRNKTKSVGTPETAKSNFAKTLGGLKESYMKKMETPPKTNVTSAQAVDAAKTERKKERLQDSQNGSHKVIPSKGMPDRKLDTKEDFWANTPTTSAAELSVEHEVVDYLTSTDRISDAASRYSDNPQGSGRLDSFFSARKNVNSYQTPFNPSTQDYHNPGFSSLHLEIGETRSGSGKHWEHTTGLGFSFDSGHGKDKGPSSELSSETASVGTSNGDVNNLSGMIGGDTFSSSTSGSPRQSNWSSSSAWDFNSSSASPRHSIGCGASSMDFSSGSGNARVGDGIINFVQAGFVDTEFMRDFKDGYVSS